VLRRFEIEEVSGAIPINPRAAFSGRLDRYGLFFDTITYTDTGSSLLGSGGVNWDLNAGVADNINVNMDLANSVTAEGYTLSLNLSNPEEVPFASRDFLQALYMSLNLDLRQFPFSRFMARQRATDYVTGSITCLGTLSSPYISVYVDSGSVSIQTLPLEFSGQMVLEDRELSLLNTVVSYGNQHIRDFNGAFSMDSFLGEITAAYDGTVGEYALAAPLRLSVFPNMDYHIPVPQQIADTFSLMPSIPSGFTVNLTVGQPTVNNEPVLEEMSFQIRRIPGRTEVSGFRDDAIDGYLLDAGNLALSAKAPLPVRFDAAGSLIGGAMDIVLDNFYGDVSAFSQLVNFPFFGLVSGIVTGSLRLGGLLTDPEFHGTLNAAAFVCNVSDYVEEPIGPTDIVVLAEYNRIYIEPVPVNVKRGTVMFDLNLLFDRWLFESLVMNIRSENQTLVDARAEIPLMILEGVASPSVSIRVTPSEVRVLGSIYVPEGIGVFAFNQEPLPPPDPDQNTHVELTINLGQRVQVSLNLLNQPVIRSLVNQDGPMTLVVNTSDNTFQFLGSLGLRGGDVTWVQRSFYVKEGHVDLNLTQNMADPVITLRAETRERDQDGNPLRIILSVDNQPFSQFAPRFTSDPIKTQEEIMALFGHAVVGENSSSFADSVAGIGTAAIDLLAHTVAIRWLEDAIRNIFNFDVFSLRVSAISSLLTNWLNNTNSVNNTGSNGNYIDLSTVYIGKYLGPEIYMEGMAHFSYDEARQDPIFGPFGTQFEFGLEMASPFANIRWAFSPLDNRSGGLPGLSDFVKANSFTLSWKFTF
jgi:hypothetical protein